MRGEYRVIVFGIDFLMYLATAVLGFGMLLEMLDNPRHRHRVQRTVYSLALLSFLLRTDYFVRNPAYETFRQIAGILVVLFLMMEESPAAIIFYEGLPEDVTERDILWALDYVTRDRYFSHDTVRIVRIRHDKQYGNYFALVEFHRRSDAEHFLDRYCPDISFRLEDSRGRDSDPITVTVREPYPDEMDPAPRDSSREDGDWECVECGIINYPHRAVCFKCKAERPEDEYSSGPVLTGETDECPQQMPSQYVVVRDLEGSVTEEVLAKGVMKLFVENQDLPKEVPATANKLKSTAPVNRPNGLGAKPGSLRRVFLMRDRKTNESWRYGFAEFATVEDAMAAVAKFRALPRFTIASKPVVVAFIHTGVFVPAFDASPEEKPEFSFSPIYNLAVRVRYWDERAYPSVRVVAADPLPGVSNDQQPGCNDDKSTATRPSKKPKISKEAPAVPKVALMPQVQLWTKASAQLHGAKADDGPDTAAAPGEDSGELKPGSIRLAPRDVTDVQPDGAVRPQPGDEYLSYADWDAVRCLACDWEPPSQDDLDSRSCPQARSDLLIEHEGRAHGFFRDPEAREKTATALAALGREPRSVIRRVPRLRSERLPVYKSYADFDRLRCLLCRRKFKDARLIWLHEQQSELHKRMLADPRQRARAAEEFKKAGLKMRILEPDPAFRASWEAQRARYAQPQYRDRALERRRAFNQPKQPVPPTAGGAEKRKEPHAAEPKEQKAEEKEPVAKKSKGAGMLAKMGWTAGSGLGAEGAGRTEAIATEVYAPGVGLGAEGGKLGDAAEEAARKTRGDFSSFVEKTRERARERFERM
ncbi:hypothetical protein VTJ49DRAFT_4889 [Mycothermus thermophilus]|uniref:RNA-binding protein n=1 Tax=Humicola insolens TaxID=85995 RepID=A0ABR3V4D5_HUMIN